MNAALIGPRQRLHWSQQIHKVEIVFALQSEEILFTVKHIYNTWQMGIVEESRWLVKAHNQLDR